MWFDPVERAKKKLARSSRRGFPKCKRLHKWEQVMTLGLNSYILKRCSRCGWFSETSHIPASNPVTIMTAPSRHFAEYLYFLKHSN